MYKDELKIMFSLDQRTDSVLLPMNNRLDLSQIHSCYLGSLSFQQTTIFLYQWVS